MITKKDLETAIAECQGKRNPDAKTCIMLAAFLTIKRELYDGEKPEPAYSYSQAPESVIEIDSGSEFAKAVDGRAQREIMPVIDELMGTVKIILPRLYDAVMDRLS